MRMNGFRRNTRRYRMNEDVPVGMEKTMMEISNFLNDVAYCTEIDGRSDVRNGVLYIRLDKDVNDTDSAKRIIDGIFHQFGYKFEDYKIEPDVIILRFTHDDSAIIRESMEYDEIDPDKIDSVLGRIGNDIYIESVYGNRMTIAFNRKINNAEDAKYIIDKMEDDGYYFYDAIDKGDYVMMMFEIDGL